MPNYVVNAPSMKYLRLPLSIGTCGPTVGPTVSGTLRADERFSYLIVNDYCLADELLSIIVKFGLLNSVNVDNNGTVVMA